MKDQLLAHRLIFAAILWVALFILLPLDTEPAWIEWACLAAYFASGTIILSRIAIAYHREEHTS